MSINDDEPYDPVAFPMKPKLAEPHWQMINPAHNHTQAASLSGSATSSSTISSENSSSTIASSVSTPKSAVSIISRPLNIQSPPLSSGSRSRANGPTLVEREIPKPRSRSATRIANASLSKTRSPSSQNYDDEDNSEDEQEARLKTAADVSIARQISVSRQQRQLLVPIKTTIKNSNSVRKVGVGANGDRIIGGQKFPITGGLGSSTISVAHVASPLGAVAVAAQAERERAASPLRERPTLKVRSNTIGTERLVEGVKPNTPTLVIVGDGVSEREEKWAGATASLKGKTGSIAERRRLKERNARGLTPVTGEIRGRLTEASAVRGTMESSSTIATATKVELQNRKSERVIVERIS
jgi:hypothetical protein